MLSSKYNLDHTSSLPYIPLKRYRFMREGEINKQSKLIINKDDKILLIFIFLILGIFIHLFINFRKTLNLSNSFLNLSINLKVTIIKIEILLLIIINKLANMLKFGKQSPLKMEWI